ncbi:hypothetical protein [Phytohabitans kaempferiae]|uniref:Uncharacterized protein n=1 Tax=Phytohabitans kaempferiae TaxID=1620943 RepID=A0ABV6M1Y2_9ACTN
MTDGSAFTDWLMSDNWQDYRQQRAIRSLGDEVSSLSSSLYTQQRESSRLRSELSKLQGSVEARLSRLIRSFDAFVELSDLRVTLAMFDPPALVRHRTRLLVAAASQDQPPPAAGFADVPGYWLAPAATALGALLRDEDAEEPLTLALERDAGRTALLITLTATAAGRADLSAAWLPKALGPLPAGEPVTRAVRALWTSAAAGVFGPDGLALVGKRLAGLVDGVDPERERTTAEAWRARIGTLPATVTRPQSILEPVPDAEKALAAGARLAALRELCAGTGGPAAPEAATDSPDPYSLAAVLRALVDEGTDEEAPLLRRSAELRAVIEDREYTDVEQWAAPLKPPLELLLDDAFLPDGSPLARMARTASARWLLPAAERLATEAATDPPREATTAIERTAVRVRAGTTPQGLDAVRDALAARYAGEPVPDKAAIACLAAGALLCVSLVAWPNALAVIATLAGAVLLLTGAVRWWQGRQRNAERQERLAANVNSAEQRAGRAAAELDDLRGRLVAAGQRAADDLAAIRNAVGVP